MANMYDGGMSSAICNAFPLFSSLLAAWWCCFCSQSHRYYRHSAGGARAVRWRGVPCLRPCDDVQAVRGRNVGTAAKIRYDTTSCPDTAATAEKGDAYAVPGDADNRIVHAPTFSVR